MRTNTTSHVMAFESMKGLNDLGNMVECENGDLADIASYVTLKLNITKLPTSLISGFCLPAECTQEKLSNFGNAATDKINGILEPLLEAYLKEPIGLDFLNQDTQLFMTLTASDEAAEDWANSVRPGYIASLVFVSLMILFTCLIPNIYLAALHYQNRAKDYELTPKADWAFKSAPQYKKTVE